ncbi:MAG TPA: helix-turn-helix domain-containing protein [Lichenihabitans sp.]|jgi:transcriptional regulator with XRE-family HTH domain|nr:helix-turn-helix domain-containing protein [Lichenihabitans sp.]
MAERPGAGIVPGDVKVKKSPNPIDRHVGSRVRMRRVLIGMSQEKLGGALGLTFQQVQKYEKGTNRIGASRLQQIAGILNVPPAFFFDDMPTIEGTGAQAGFAEDTSGFVVDFLASSEGLLLNRAFVRIKETRVRKKIIDLVTALADEQLDEARTPAGDGRS